MVSPPAADVINAGDGEEVGGELEGGRDGEGGVDAVVDVGDVAHVAVEQEPGHHPVIRIKLLWIISNKKVLCIIHTERRKIVFQSRTQQNS